MARAFRGADTSGSTGTTINLDISIAVDIDSDGCINDSDGTFTVPASWNGRYGMLVGNVRTTTTEDGGGILEVSTDGGSTWSIVSRQDGSSLVDPIVSSNLTSGSVLFNTGDKYRLSYTGSSATLTTLNNFLSGFYLDSNDSNNINFLRVGLTGSGDFSIEQNTSTNFDFGKVLDDTSNAYDNTIETIVIPPELDGHYAVVFLTLDATMSNGATLYPTIEYSQDSGVSYSTVVWQRINSGTGNRKPDWLCTGPMRVSEGDRFRPSHSTTGFSDTFEILNNDGTSFSAMFLQPSVIDSAGPGPEPVDSSFSPVDLLTTTGLYYEVGPTTTLDSTGAEADNAEGIGTLTDLGSGGYDATQSTLANMPVYDSDSSAAVFDGSTDRMLTGGYFTAENQSIFARFRLDAAGSGTRTIIGTVGSAGEGTPRAWLSTTNGKLSAGLGSVGSDAFQDSDQRDLRGDGWHVGGVAWDSSNMFLYLDGVQVNTTARSGSIPPSSRTWLLGARQTSTGQDLYWDGAISHTLVVDRRLTDSEIADLTSYFNGPQPFAVSDLWPDTPPPVALYYDVGTSTVENFSSTTATNGQPVSFVEDLGNSNFSELIAEDSSTAPTFVSADNSLLFASDDFLWPSSEYSADVQGSIAIRFKGNTLGGGKKVLAGVVEDAVNNPEISLYTNGGMIAAQVGTSGNATIQSIIDVNDDTWRVATMTWNDSNLNLYLDSDLIDNEARTSSTPSSLPMVFGKRYVDSGLGATPSASNTDLPFPGSMSHILILERMMTDSEIGDLVTVWNNG